MPRPCSVCHHPEHATIDRDLVQGLTYRNISKRFDISIMALARHKQAHVPLTLVKAHEAETVAQADDLLAQVRQLQAKAWGILQQAEGAGQLMIALAAIREARGLIELLGRLMGELQDAHTINVVLSPEWQQIRRVFLEALQPYPEARVSVARALLTIEGANGSHH
jgi:hypothetical protein